MTSCQYGIEHSLRAHLIWAGGSQWWSHPVVILAFMMGSSLVSLLSMLVMRCNEKLDNSLEKLPHENSSMYIYYEAAIVKQKSRKVHRFWPFWLYHGQNIQSVQCNVLQRVVLLIKDGQLCCVQSQHGSSAVNMRQEQSIMRQPNNKGVSSDRGCHNIPSRVSASWSK